jgi:hypothetical protein
MTKQGRTKLVVARETMRTLNRALLAEVAGGRPPPPDSRCEPCPPLPPGPE